MKSNFDEMVALIEKINRMEQKKILSKMLLRYYRLTALMFHVKHLCGIIYKIICLKFLFKMACVEQFI